MSSLRIEEVMQAGLYAQATMADGNRVEYPAQPLRNPGEMLEVHVQVGTQSWRTGALVHDGEYCVEYPPATFRVFDEGKLRCQYNVALRRVPLPINGWTSGER